MEPTWFEKMMDAFLRRAGLKKAVLLITLVAVAISVLLTSLFSLLTTGEVRAFSVIMAAIMPAVISPPFSITILHLIYQLQHAEERLLQLSVMDELTQAHNRRYFIEAVRKRLDAARRYGGTFAVIILDADDFKRINDTYGHMVGDQTLQRLSEICRACIRRSDDFARYGGEEFAFLLPYSGASEAVRFAERIREELRAVPLLEGDPRVTLTVSMGVAVYEGDITSIETLLARADSALYAAKNAGKDRITVYQAASWLDGA